MTYDQIINELLNFSVVIPSTFEVGQEAVRHLKRIKSTTG